MKRYVKNSLIFAGGVTTGLAVGSIAMAALMIKHKEYVKQCIVDATERWLFDSECDCRKEVVTDVE